MGNKWGVNRTVAQIHTSVFGWQAHAHAEELVDTLGVKPAQCEQQHQRTAKPQSGADCACDGDRRDYFTTGTDVWELAKVIVRKNATARLPLR